MKTTTRTFRLPTLPAVAIRLLNVFSDPDVAIRDVARLIETDPALAAKILKAANSVQFGCGRGIADIARALTLLGKRTVTSLALGFSLSEVATGKGKHKQLFEEYWLQAVVRALTCEHLGRRYARGKEGELFICGLLSSIGWLALLHSEPDSFAELRAQDGNDLRVQLERQRMAYGTDYLELTGRLLDEWKLPQDLIHAVQNQLEDVTVFESMDPKEITIFNKIVSISTSMGDFLCSDQRALSLIRIHELMGLFFNAPEAEIDLMISQVRDKIAGSAEMFQTDASTIGSPTEILAQAMDQLSELAASALKDNSAPNSHDVLEENGRLRRRVEELTRRSTIDPLTHVFNRGYLVERLSEQIAVARLRQQRLGLVFIDVDHFKKVNDTYGHPAGDKVLEKVARAIESVIRASDVLGRYGGEEFIVLVGPTDQSGLERVSERIRLKIAQEVIEYESTRIGVTASIGGAILGPPVEGDNFQERLIEAADASMYAAKRGGRNQVVLLCTEEDGTQRHIMPSRSDAQA
jgi:diguanylate cyclase (GGDEF)-like protein